MTRALWDRAVMRFGSLARQWANPCPPERVSYHVYGRDVRRVTLARDGMVYIIECKVRP